MSFISSLVRRRSADRSARSPGVRGFVRFLVGRRLRQRLIRVDRAVLLVRSAGIVGRMTRSGPFAGPMLIAVGAMERLPSGTRRHLLGAYIRDGDIGGLFRLIRPFGLHCTVSFFDFDDRVSCRWAFA
jgi:hypothetical protein